MKFKSTIIAFIFFAGIMMNFVQPAGRMTTLTMIIFLFKGTEM